MYVNKIKALVKSHFLKGFWTPLCCMLNTFPPMSLFCCLPPFPPAPFVSLDNFVCIYVYTQMLLCIYIKSRDHKREKNHFYLLENDVILFFWIKKSIVHI